MWAQGTTSSPQPSVLQGHVRQVGDVVFFRAPDGTEHELYDFSIGVGDSVRYEVFGSDMYLHVISVASMLIQGVPHRVIQFDTDTEFITPESFFQDRWIEGIGSIHGPLAPIRAMDIEDTPQMDSTRTTCFLEGSTMLWQHASYTDCTNNIISSVQDLHAAIVRPYPNPSSGQVTITGLPHGTWPYRMLDALGRTVLQGHLNGADGAQIDIAALPAGPYLLQVGMPAVAHLRLIKE